MELLTTETQLKIKQLSASLSEQVEINSDEGKKLRIKQNELTLTGNEIKKLENEKFKLNQKLSNLNDSVVEVDTKCTERLNNLRNDLNTSHIKMSSLNFGTSKNPDVLTTNLSANSTITAFTVNELDLNKYGNSKYMVGLKIGNKMVGAKSNDYNSINLPAVVKKICIN